MLSPTRFTSVPQLTLFRAFESARKSPVHEDFERHSHQIAEQLDISRETRFP